MPFEIIHDEENKCYRVKNIKKDRIVKTKFKTRDKAINQAKNWMRYRGEYPIVVGELVTHNKHCNI